MDAIRPDHQIEGFGFVARELNRGTILILDYPGRRVPHSETGSGQFRLERLQQVGTVNGQLRRAVFALCRRAHLDARGFLARVPGSADPVGGLGRRGAQRRTQIQPVQRMNGVGGQVDIRPDAGEPLGLFENAHVMAHAAQRDGGT